MPLLNRKMVSAITFTLLLVGTLALTFNIQSVNASGTIYIRADGSIDPPTAPISTVDNVTYIFTGDINDSIVIERNSVVVDGAGYTLQGSGDAVGISISNVNGVTLRNTCIKEFNYGIYVQASRYDTVIGNNITASKSAGIYLYYSYNNNVARNLLSGSGISSFGGIRLNCASYNNITANTIESNNYGIYFYNSESNHIYHNNFLNNAHNAYGTWDMSFASPGNIWNDSYPFGGNRWTDYNGTDLYSGGAQSEIGSDGMGDTPKSIQVVDFSGSLPTVFYELDIYPLMKLWRPYDNGTICINADGTVAPSGAPILRKGDFYTLYSNINSDSNGIIVERNGATLDVIGNTIVGHGNGTGISINQMQNVTLLNARVEAFQDGISVQNSSYIRIVGNNLTSSVADGIYLSGGEYSIIANNVITKSGNSAVELCSTNGNLVSHNLLVNSSFGMKLQRSNNNSVLNNNLTSNDNGLFLFLSSGNNFGGNFAENNTRGVNLQLSSDNALTTNIMVGNLYSFGVFGESLMDFMNSIDTSNHIDGKPVFYLLNETSVVVDSEAGYVGFINCRNVTAKDLTLENNINGLLLAYTSNSTIIGNYVAENEFGISLSKSSSNSIIGNTVSDNDCGIFFNRSSTNSMSENSIVDNRNGIFFSESWRNNISKNNIVGNHESINLSASSNNLIYHNNFTSNEIQLSSDCDYPNAWDNGYPSGGNYWSDYTGVDFFSGPCQNESRSDGIGDVPYTINANNTDHCPLMKPWTSPDIAVTYLAISNTIVGRGLPVHLNSTIENQGNKIEFFTLNVFHDETLLRSENFSLFGNLAMMTELDSIAFDYGNYTLGVNVEPLQDEFDTADNTMSISFFVTIPGDINGDKTVDIYDALIFASHFGFTSIHPLYDPIIDLDDDGTISVFDAILLASNFGKQWT